MAENGRLYSPEVDLLYKCSNKLDVYHEHLCSLYDEPDMAHREFDHWKVTELRTCMDNNKLEVLVVTFTNDKENKVHLRILRTTKYIRTKASGQGVITRPRSPDSDNDQGPLKFVARVIDIVYIETREDTMGRRPPVEHIMFPEGHRISLPKFIFLASTIKEYSKTYHFKQANCSGLCYVIKEALKARYPEHRSLPIQGSTGHVALSV